MYFDDVVENRLKKIKETLTRKADEYATDTDRFHNFRVAADFVNTTREQALYGMMLKHLVSVQDMVLETERGKGCRVTAEFIDEKIGDTINYLILLEGIFAERLDRGRS